MAAVAHVESSFNPFAIGVVAGRLERQPANKAEAVVTAKALEKAGFNFSVGVGQVNRYNLPKYGLNYETAFDACPNLHAASLILKDCYDRAKARWSVDQAALQAAFSCYYSGNFSTGFKQDFSGQPSYVQKVLSGASVSGISQAVTPIQVIGRAKTELAAKSPDDGAFRVTAERTSPSTTAVTANVGNTDASVMVYR
jgi:type IV secretion system protein VirB1